MNKLLEINHLTKNYITNTLEINAIKDLTFDVYEGEIISIVGTSGCGKSSLLSILAGIDSQSSGSYTFLKDKDISIGYMLQSDSLFPWLTIFENAILGLKIKKEDTKENKEYVSHLLDTYNLGEFKDKYPDELSGGMRQRVG